LAFKTFLIHPSLKLRTVAKPSTPNKRGNAPAAPASRDLLDMLDDFFLRREKFFLWLSIVLALLFSLLLFDVKPSVGGDDSAYVQRAYDLVHDFTYPTFQGPLYPMFLAPFVALFGIRLVLFKTLSLLLMLVHTWFFFRAFRGRVPAHALAFSLLLTSINSYLLYFASQTYSEALFFFLQSVFFFYFFKHFIPPQGQELPAFALRQDAKAFAGLGGLLLLMGLSRSIGYAALGGIALYFALMADWRRLGASVASFGLFAGAFALLKRLLWGGGELQFESQANTLFLKEPYYPDRGYEDFAGYLGRIVENSLQYFGKFFYVISGYVDPMGTTSVGLTLLTYVMLLGGLVVIFRRNRHLLFVAAYLLAMLGVSFLMLQKIFTQGRFLYVFFPLMVLFLFSSFHYASKGLSKWAQVLTVAFVAWLFAGTFKVLSTEVRENRPVLQANLAGNLLAGYSPDWQNYILMSQYAAQNLPDSVRIGCRKPSISFLYGNRPFSGIFTVPSEDADTLLMELREREIRYIIMGNLRKYETHKTEFTINTIHRYLGNIAQKYPEKVRQLHVIGTDEEAYLFEVIQ